MSPWIEVTPPFAIIIMAVATAIGNKWSGWEHGDRYTGSLFIALVGWALFGVVGISLGIAMLLWRLIGWHRSIDMGRNEDSFFRDFAVMAAISYVPALVIGLATWSYWPASLIFTMPLCYTIAMWGLPWKPQFRHISVAEVLAGLTFGATSAITILYS